jgi:hypothetical protein
MAALITDCEQGTSQSATRQQTAVLNGKRQRTEVEEVTAAAAHNEQSGQDGQPGVSGVLDGKTADGVPLPAAAEDKTGFRLEDVSPPISADVAAKEVCAEGPVQGPAHYSSVLMVTGMGIGRFRAARKG